MSASQKIDKVGAKRGKATKGSQGKKLKFTPPMLHKYGEIVKICQAAPTMGQNDFFTS